MHKSENASLCVSTLLANKNAVFHATLFNPGGDPGSRVRFSSTVLLQIHNGQLILDIC